MSFARCSMTPDRPRFEERNVTDRLTLRELLNEQPRKRYCATRRNRS